MLRPTPRPEWARTYFGSATGDGVRVAVLDSGWDRDTANPPSGVTDGVSFLDTPIPGVEGESVDHDSHGHGTQCTWLIAGIAPTVTLTPVRIFGAAVQTSVEILIRAIAWGVAEGFDILNLSLGTGQPSAITPLYSICEAANKANVIVVASLDPTGMRPFPGAFDNVLSASPGEFISPFEFAYEAGAAAECKIGARRLAVTTLGNVVVQKSGSSLAAAQLAGIIALIRNRHRGATIDDVRAVLATFSR
jgi:subtilisin family serine protease